MKPIRYHFIRVILENIRNFQNIKCSQGYEEIKMLIYWCGSLIKRSILEKNSTIFRKGKYVYALTTPPLTSQVHSET